MIIIQEDFDKMEQQANQFYSKNRTIKSDILGDIHLSPLLMNHLRIKGNHKRSMQEIYMRYLCLLSAQKLISKLSLYQEYKADYTTIIDRRNGKNTKVIKMAEFFGFVGIVDTGKSKNRIRLVVRKIYDQKRYELYSVIPSWNSKGYSYFGSES